MPHKYDPNCKCEVCTVRRLSDEAKQTTNPAPMRVTVRKPMPLDDGKTLEQRLTEPEPKETMRSYMLRKNRREGKIR